MKVSATPRQMDALRFIHGYHLAHGRSPSHAELAKGIGSPKGAATQNRLVALEERGLIWRSAHRDHNRNNIFVLAPPAIPRSPTGEPLYFVSVP